MSEEETMQRGNWKNWWEFLFSSVGCLVGLGNIWRFPYICFKNGGGAFLIPYFIFMFLCAMPMMFLEMTFSQYSNLGPGKVWVCCPLLKGIGYGMVILTGLVSTYYNVILAWALYYLGMSFYPQLPWTSCNNDWNTVHCMLRGMNTSSPNSSLLVENHLKNATNVANNTDMLRTPAEEFWEHNVLDLSDGIDNLGSIRWQLLLCLFAAWLVVFLCLFKGIKTSGKVVYVAATVPYLFLMTLFIRGLTFNIDGAVKGLGVFLIPRWEDLLKFSVWCDAAVQMFYSAGLGWGGIATLASYNNFNNNVFRDAMILPIVDVVTSVFAGCVVFVTLGFMAEEAGVSIDKVVDSGPGIAFIVYPEAVSKLPLPQLWAVLFFLMLFVVGLDSQMVHVQTLTGALLDNFPKVLYKWKTALTGVLCFLGFLLGIPCITQGGVYILTLIDWYSASVAVMLLTFLEVASLAWLYGVDRIYKDLEVMIGYKPSSLWKIMWLFVTPLAILIIWIVSLVRYSTVTYGEYKYPTYAVGIGWLIAISSLVSIFVGIISTLLNTGDQSTPLFQKLRISIQPTTQWKPAVTTPPGGMEMRKSLI
ncbi:sodium- and chloride-dependent glycine transporter 1-like [Ostrea edulis]|uniref:sodium- and chloride-dependent glycine transporter 1-like n=1 Tax=Ostrea edulis TaxID=37623 RepID=UPI0024AF2CB1|nr:sodium- and chloride-dependent glycine transporter 1-like [Ostrea edulis]